MYNKLKYTDYCLLIFEVAKIFPDGFNLQPLQGKPIKVWINSARYAELTVLSWTKSLKKKVIFFEQPDDLFDELMKYLINNVQGGITSYVRIFFSRDGYHRLDKENE